MQELNLLAPDFQNNPHPLLAEQRETGNGVHYQSQADAWVVHRHADVRAALRDTQRFSNMWPGRLGRDQQRMSTRAAARAHRTMVFSDPPIHTRLRALVSSAFNPQAVRRLEDRIVSIADRVVGELEEGAEIDFVEAIAARMPVLVIAAMIGVEAGSEREFSNWAHAATVFAAPVADADVRQENVGLAAQFWRFAADTVSDRRRHPRDDLVSELLNAELDGDRLSDEDVTSILHVLLVGSFETTRTALTNFFWQMFELPDVYAKLQAHPEALSRVFEEVLRLEPPLFFVPRVTKEPVRFGATVIDADEVLLLSLASANRDPRAFDRPDELAFERSSNNHVSFGFGAHFCIGAPIIRREADILLSRLTRRFPGIRAGTALAERYPMTFSRAFSRFPVKLETTCASR